MRFRKSSEYIRFDASEPELSGNAFLPSIALVPLLQHSGVAAKPLVSIGETVREGQIIARGLTTSSANVHASIPGVVQDFKSVPMPDGSMQSTAVIRLAGSFDILGKKTENYPWRNVPPSEILRIIEDKGLINTFEKPTPLAPALQQMKQSNNAAIALRLFDNDPTSKLDAFLVKNNFQPVIEGYAILAKSINAKHVYFMYTGKSRDCPVSDKQLELFTECKITFVRVSDRYPSGNRGQFLSHIRSRSGKETITEALLVDPVTVVSAYDAVVKNTPCLNRYIIVTGSAIGKTCALKVRIGTPIGDVIEECGGFKTDPARIIINGLLEGHAVYDLDTPITKYVKSLHIMDRESCPPYTVRNCVHCGRCMQVCPVSIDPQRIAACIRMDKLTPKVLKAISACQYCGCCAIVCPSRIPLPHVIREVANRTKGMLQ
jgi:electron transport complex protein RnfC